MFLKGDFFSVLNKKNVTHVHIYCTCTHTCCNLSQNLCVRSHTCVNVCLHCTLPREYWMIYRGPGFLEDEMIWLLPHHLSRQLVVSLSQSPCVSLVELTNGTGNGGGAQSYDGEKAWSSINHSLLSGSAYTCMAYPCSSSLNTQIRLPGVGGRVAANG